MANQEQILHELTQAEAHIATAKMMIQEPPDVEFVPVNPGDNIMQLIQDNEVGTKFKVHNDFVQNVGDAELPKPCTLISERGKLICHLSVKPNTHFIGMTLDGAGENTILTAADDMTIDSSILNGNANGQHRGIAINAKRIRIRNNRILNIFKYQDTQAVGGWDGTDDVVISGNDLEASGENIMLGGAASSSPENMPRNVIIEDNHMFKRLAWRADSRAACKNLLELKACDNVQIRRNVMEYSFVDAQIGYAVVISVRNDDGTAPWSTITNVIYEDNVHRHSAGGISFLGRDDTPDEPSGVMSNVLIKNNKFEDINQELFGGNGREIFISGGPDKLTLDGNSFYSGGRWVVNGIYFDQPWHLCTNLVIKNQEHIVEGNYGIFGTDAGGLGKIVLDKYAPGYVWENNKVLKSGVRNINWPEGTIFLN